MAEIKQEVCLILEQVAKSQNIANFEVFSNAEGNYGDGFVAQFYTGDVLNKETGETTAVAIKKAPIWEFDYAPIFRNEDIFYNTIIPALDEFQKELRVSKPFDNVPKYFCGGMKLKEEYIAMENVKPLGYVMFDKKQYLGQDHLERLFKIYGKFHALSYVLRYKNLEKYTDISKNLTDLSDMMIKFMDKQMTAAVSSAVDALNTENDKIIYEELQDLKEHAAKTWIKSTSYSGVHRCLVHGDCWSNNMLFKYSDSGELLDIKLIDFQLCQENTPINDLSYFFYSGASKRDFDNLDDYLQIYHQSFSEFAKELGAKPEELFSFDTLKEEWKEYAVFGALFGIFLWQVKLTPKENFANVLNPEEPNPTKSFEENFKDLEVILEKVHNTDAYRDRTAAILRHAFEYGVLNKNKIVRNI